MEKKNQTRIITSQREDWPLSFACPENWELRTLAVRDGVRFFLRGPLDPAEALFASITVQAQPGEGRTLSELAREWTERHSAFRTFRLLAHSETNLAGIEAIQIDAAHDMPLPPGSLRPEMVAVRERIIFALQGETAYELTYRATKEDFETHLPVFEALVASFSLESVYLT